MMNPSWWSSKRVHDTVTSAYITERLPSAPSHRSLQDPVEFGGGLTDNTYHDWILEKGRRLFLVLDDIGLAGKIFDAIDKSFDDADLPLSEEAVRELDLPGVKTKSLEKKFLRRQYWYVVQELQAGAHINYSDEEIVPVDVVPKGRGLFSTLPTDRVHANGSIYVRRDTPLHGGSGEERAQFGMRVKAMQKLNHPRLVRIFASYTYKAHGSVLITPVTKSNLKSFLAEPSKQFKRLSKTSQRESLLRWICHLVIALDHMHENGYSHQAIRPSNIVLDGEEKLYLSGFGVLKENGSANDREGYEYDSPEQWRKKSVLTGQTPMQSRPQRVGQQVKDPMSPGHFSYRPNSFASSSSSRPSTSGDANSASNIDDRPHTGYLTDMAFKFSTTRPLSPLSQSATSPPKRTTARRLSEATRYINPVRPRRVQITALNFSESAHRPRRDQSSCFPSDIFSLSVTIIQILSLVLSLSSARCSPAQLRCHLAKRNRLAGRGGAPADSSFHANLDQVQSWLDLLEEKADPNGRSAKKDKADDQAQQWRPAVTHLVALARQGVCYDPTQRWTSAEGVRAVREIMDGCGFAFEQLCSPSPEQASPSARDSRSLDDDRTMPTTPGPPAWSPCTQASTDKPSGSRPTLDLRAGAMAMPSWAEEPVPEDPPDGWDSVTRTHGTAEASLYEHSDDDGADPDSRSIFTLPLTSSWPSWDRSKMRTSQKEGPPWPLTDPAETTGFHARISGKV